MPVKCYILTLVSCGSVLCFSQFLSLSLLLSSLCWMFFAEGFRCRSLDLFLSIRGVGLCLILGNLFLTLTA